VSSFQYDISINVVLSSAFTTVARFCQRLRRISALIYVIAVLSFGVGATFAFVLPGFST
jgi:hypothetical protein